MKPTRNEGLLENLSAYYPKRNEPNFVWGNILSYYGMLPGLINFFSMGSRLAASNTIYSQLSQVTSLAASGATSLTKDRIIPTVTMNGGYYYATATANTVAARTVMAWVKHSAPIYLAGVQPIAAIWGTAGSRCWQLVRDANYAAFHISDDGTAIVTINSMTSINNANWHFYAGRFNPSNEIAVFLDDDKQGAVTAATKTYDVISAQLRIGANSDSKVSSNGTQISMVAICGEDVGDAIVRLVYSLTKPMFT